MLVSFSKLIYDTSIMLCKIQSNKREAFIAHWNRRGCLDIKPIYDDPPVNEIVILGHLPITDFRKSQVSIHLRIGYWNTSTDNVHYIIWVDNLGAYRGKLINSDNF